MEHLKNVTLHEFFIAFKYTVILMIETHVGQLVVQMIETHVG